MESVDLPVYPYTFQNTPTPNFGVGDEWKVWIFPPGLPLHQNWCWGLMPGGEGVWIYPHVLSSFSSCSLGGDGVR